MNSSNWKGWTGPLGKYGLIYFTLWSSLHWRGFAGLFITCSKHLRPRAFSSGCLSNASARTLSKHIPAVRCSLPGLVIERTQRPRYSLVLQGPWLQTKIVLVTHHHDHINLRKRVWASAYPLVHGREALHYALIPCEHTFTLRGIIC